MNKINTDGNLAALSRYERQQDEYDTLREQHEQSANEAAFEEIVSGDDLPDYISDLPSEVFEEMAVALYKCYEAESPDYCEFGRLFIQHLTDGIVESKYFDDLSDRWIENQQGN